MRKLKIILLYLAIIMLATASIIAGWNTHSITLSLVCFSLFGWCGYYLSNHLAKIKDLLSEFDRHESNIEEAYTELFE